MLAGLESPAASLLGLQVAAFVLCSHRDIDPFVLGYTFCVSSCSHEDTSLVGVDPYPVSSCNPDYSLKAPSLRQSHEGLGLQDTYEFWGLGL